MRFLSSLALLTLAAGFAAVIVDGTRSIAGNELSLTPFADLIKSRLPGLEAAIGRNIHPLLWDPVTVSLLKLPAWVIFALAGLFLLWLASRRRCVVGRSSRA